MRSKKIPEGDGLKSKARPKRFSKRIAQQKESFDSKLFDIIDEIKEKKQGCDATSVSSEDPLFFLHYLQLRPVNIEKGLDSNDTDGHKESEPVNSLDTEKKPVLEVVIKDPKTLELSTGKCSPCKSGEVTNDEEDISKEDTNMSETSSYVNFKVGNGNDHEIVQVCQDSLSNKLRSTEDANESSKEEVDASVRKKYVFKDKYVEKGKGVEMLSLPVTKSSSGSSKRRYDKLIMDLKEGETRLRNDLREAQLLNSNPLEQADIDNLVKKVEDKLKVRCKKKYESLINYQIDQSKAQQETFQELLPDKMESLTQNIKRQLECPNTESKRKRGRPMKEKNTSGNDIHPNNVSKPRCIGKKNKIVKNRQNNLSPKAGTKTMTETIQNESRVRKARKRNKFRLEIINKDGTDQIIELNGKKLRTKTGREKNTNKRFKNICEKGNETTQDTNPDSERNDKSNGENESMGDKTHISDGMEKEKALEGSTSSKGEETPVKAPRKIVPGAKPVTFTLPSVASLGTDYELVSISPSDDPRRGDFETDKFFIPQYSFDEKGKTGMIMVGPFRVAKEPSPHLVLVASSSADPNPSAAMILQRKAHSPSNTPPRDFRIKRDNRRGGAPCRPPPKLFFGDPNQTLLDHNYMTPPELWDNVKKYCKLVSKHTAKARFIDARVEDITPTDNSVVVTIKGDNVLRMMKKLPDPAQAPMHITKDGMPVAYTLSQIMTPALRNVESKVKREQMVQDSCNSGDFSPVLFPIPLMGSVAVEIVMPPGGTEMIPRSKTRKRGQRILIQDFAGPKQIDPASKKNSGVGNGNSNECLQLNKTITLDETDISSALKEKCSSNIDGSGGLQFLNSTTAIDLEEADGCDEPFFQKTMKEKCSPNIECSRGLQFLNSKTAIDLKEEDECDQNLFEKTNLLHQGEAEKNKVTSTEIPDSAIGCHDIENVSTTENTCTIFPKDDEDGTKIDENDDVASVLIENEASVTAHMNGQCSSGVPCCPHCLRLFSNARVLVNHIRTVHNIQVEKNSSTHRRACETGMTTGNAFLLTPDTNSNRTMSNPAGSKCMGLFTPGYVYHLDGKSEIDYPGSDVLLTVQKQHEGHSHQLDNDINWQQAYNYSPERSIHKKRKAKNPRRFHQSGTSATGHALYQQTAPEAPSPNLSEYEHGCSLCHAKFSDTGKLEMHYQIAHAALLQAQDYPDSGMVNLVKQRQCSRYGRVNERSMMVDCLTCSKCDTVFHNQPSLLQHTLKVHPELNPLNVCRLCDRLFSDSLSLHRHLKKSHGLNSAGAIKCLFCPAWLPSIELATVHRVTFHQGALPVHCPFCGAGSQSLHAMYNHVRQHHLQTEIHICPDCQASFASHKSLSEHAKKIHGMTAQVLRENLRQARGSNSGATYCCPFCDVAVPRTYELASHVITAHRDHLLPRQCHLCMQAFVSAVILKVHLASAHGVCVEEEEEDDSGMVEEEMDIGVEVDGTEEGYLPQQQHQQDEQQTHHQHSQHGLHHPHDHYYPHHLYGHEHQDMDDFQEFEDAQGGVMGSELGVEENNALSHHHANLVEQDILETQEAGRFLEELQRHESNTIVYLNERNEVVNIPIDDQAATDEIFNNCHGIDDVQLGENLNLRGVDYLETLNNDSIAVGTNVVAAAADGVSRDQMLDNQQDPLSLAYQFEIGGVVYRFDGEGDNSATHHQEEESSMESATRAISAGLEELLNH